MFNRFVIVISSVICFLPGFHVVTADGSCACEPIFTPPRLVVKYGDPTSATCLGCHHVCNVDMFGLEYSVGTSSENGSTILWKIDSLNEWEISPMCYYDDDDDNQHMTRLPITVYQPLKDVDFGFLNSGPMIAGRQYTLQCTVQEVAPIGLLNVTFYRGQTPLQSLQSSSTTKEPVTKTFTLNITPTKEDNGGLYWCEAKLDLGAEGPQPPPVVTSEKITTTVYYKPQLKGSSYPDPIAVIAGSTLHLNCSSVGNPSPSYTWTLPSPSRSSLSGDTLSIESVTSTDGGQYTCSAHNAVGHITVEFDVVFYNYPKNAHLSFINHSGLMFEGRQYTVQCTVQEVPPVGNLNVTFYRGQTPLDQQNIKNKPVETPLNKTFTLNITPTKEDDGGLYWCETKLDLGAEGPQPPPVVTSQNITATVYYKPQLKGSSHPDPITVIAGSSLHLNCSSVGNPSPSYTWTLPSASRSSFSGDTLSIESLTPTDGGQYTCSAHNVVGNVTVEFTVVFYNPPNNVHLSFLDHSGPMYTGQQYILQCTVQEVPPIGNLTVTFYRAQTPLGQKNVKNKPVETTVNKTFTLDISPHIDGGGLYWCEAELELGAEGPQPPPVVTSKNINATVNYGNCACKPVFTPSRLTVKYGDPTSSTCLGCQHVCNVDMFDLEYSVGVMIKNGSMISWKIDSLTEWDISPLCFFNDIDDNQYISRLPVTVYQPPKSVHLSFLNHSGPMFAGRQYTLQCTVQEVAPIGNVTVTFYRGQTQLGQQNIMNKPIETPVTETFTLNITATKEDDGGLYWCEAELDLGAEGPQPPPVVTSEKIMITVYYKPQLKGSSHPDPITIIAGHPLHLNCSSVGNPSPSYTWTLPSPSRSSPNGSTLSIESVTSVDGGRYTCFIHNVEGSVTVEFIVVVQNQPELKQSSPPDP